MALKTTRKKLIWISGYGFVNTIRPFRFSYLFVDKTASNRYKAILIMWTVKKTFQENSNDTRKKVHKNLTLFVVT